MASVALDVDEATLELDACRKCHLVWFDPHEREALGARPVDPPSASEPLPEEAVRVLATAAAERERARLETRLEGAVPNIPGWQWPATYLGLPVEIDEPPRAIVPWLTWLLVAALFVGGLCMWPTMEGPPDVAFLLIAVYLGAVFADNVEDVLGHAGFVLLLVASGIASVLAWHLIAGAPPPYRVPIGAALATCMTVYVLVFPNARMGFRFWHFFVKDVHWYRFRAFWVLVVFLFCAWVFSIIPGGDPLAAMASLLAACGVGIGAARLVD